MLNEQIREDIRCLIDSPYRGPLLLALREGISNRTELRETIDASRATVSRALSVFEDRDWVARSGQEYQLTTLGTLVADEFATMVDTMGTINELRGVVEYLPINEMGFDIGHLRDATVVKPSESDPLAPIRHADRFVEEAESLAILSHSFSPGTIEVIDERAKAGAPTQVVVTTSVVDSLASDPTLGGMFHESLRSDALEIREYDGEIPHVIAIADEIVSIGVVDDKGRIHGVIDTDNETILEWAEATIVDYRERAIRLQPERFP